MYTDRVNYCVKCGLYPAMLELRTLIVVDCINIFFNIFFPTQHLSSTWNSFFHNNTSPPISASLFVFFICASLFRTFQSMLKTCARIFVLLLSRRFIVPTMLHDLWIPPKQSLPPPHNIKTMLIPHIDTINMALNISWSFYFAYELPTFRICSLITCPYTSLSLTTLRSFPLLINYIVAFNSLFFSCRFYVMSLKN